MPYIISITPNTRMVAVIMVTVHIQTLAPVGSYIYRTRWTSGDVRIPALSVQKIPGWSTKHRIHEYNHVNIGELHLTVMQQLQCQLVSLWFRYLMTMKRFRGRITHATRSRTSYLGCKWYTLGWVEFKILEMQFLQRCLIYWIILTWNEQRRTL